MPHHNLRLVRFDCAELRPYHRNPRRGDVEAITRSLEINGQYRPIVVNLGTTTGRPLEVLAGNHTLAAAKALQWSQIDAVTVDVDDMEAARIVAADNRTGDLGGYDNDLLIELLGELEGLDGTGYTDDDLSDMLDLAEGPPTLDELADEYGDPRDDDNHVMIRLSVPPTIATQWDEHRSGWDTDGEALEALLDR